MEYINLIPKYCVYLTIYSGTKLPPFYIGSGTISKIKNKKNPYRGTVGSKRYFKIWKKELNNNPHLFRTIILYKFFSRKNATYHERLLQIQFNVIDSCQFINMGLAHSSYNYTTKPTEETRKKLRESARSKPKQTLETRQKRSNSMRGKVKTHEHLQKISVALTGKKRGKLPQEHCDNISKAKTGVKRGSFTDEWRLNISKSNEISVTIDGVTYESKKKAMLSLGLTQYMLKKTLETQKEAV